ncbi:hypothetical protein [Streptomyces sp. NPDC001296]
MLEDEAAAHGVAVRRSGCGGGRVAAVEEAGRAGKHFFTGVLLEQAFQADRQAALAFLLAALDFLGQALAEEVAGVLTVGRRCLADGLGGVRPRVTLSRRWPLWSG